MPMSTRKKCPGRDCMSCACSSIGHCQRTPTDARGRTTRPGSMPLSLSMATSSPCQIRHLNSRRPRSLPSRPPLSTCPPSRPLFRSRVPASDTLPRLFFANIRQIISTIDLDPGRTEIINKYRFILKFYISNLFLDCYGLSISNFMLDILHS